MNLPLNESWKSSQSGDKQGDFIASKNIDMNETGVVTLAKNAIVLCSHDDDGAFASPIAIAATGDVVNVITDGESVTGTFAATSFDDPLLAFGQALATDAVQVGPDSDIEYFNGAAHVTGQGDMSELDALGGSYHSPHRLTNLTTGVPHPVCKSEHQNAFAIGNGNTVRLYDTSYSLTTTLTIPVDYVVTVIRWRQNFLYIGTRNVCGGDAKLFVWNGTGTSAQAGYTVRADWIYSMCEYTGSMALVVSSGQILRFNGGGFDQIAAFPVYYTPYSWSSNAPTSSLVGKVASRGMAAAGDLLYINIDGSLNNSALIHPGTYLPEQPSGLWVFDPAVGLYHKAGYNYKTRLKLAATALNSNYVSFATPHQAQTGDPVMYSGAFTGLTPEQVYYAIVDDDASPTTCKLAVSPADALAGREIVISGTPSGSDYFVFNRYESLGQTSITSPGAVFVFGRTHPLSFYGSEVLFGGSTIDENQNAKGVLMSLGMGRNRGYFVTPKISASKIQDTYQKLLQFLDGLTLATDEIVVKYRLTKKPYTPLFFTGSATWTSPTTFTVDTTKKDFKGVAVGDEIEIVEGACAGYSAHVVAIDSASSVYVVTIDETMPLSSGSFDFIADNWRKLPVTTTATVGVPDGIAELTVGKKGHWIEYKVELRGRGVIIDEMQSVTAPHR